MNREIKIIHVAHNAAGLPDKKGVGRELITWLQQDYRLVNRVEVAGDRTTQSHTVLTFRKEA